MQTVYNIGTKSKFCGEVGGHMVQSTILDTQKCEHETASILNNFAIAFGKVHWGFPDLEIFDSLFEDQQFLLLLCTEGKAKVELNHHISNMLPGGLICVRKSDAFHFAECEMHDMQFLWLPFTFKRICECSCADAAVLNDFLCGKLSAVGYDEQLVDYSMFLKKRICGGKRCCLEPVLSGFILDCIFALAQNREALSDREKLVAYLKEHAKDKISVPELAKMMSVSERSLFYFFKKNFQTSPTDFINCVRMNAAAEHIHRGLSVKEVTEMYHFSESSAFCRLFKKYFGITPTEYRQLAEKSQLKIVSRDKLKD